MRAFAAGLSRADVAGWPLGQLIVPAAAEPLVVRKVSEVCCGASDLAAFV
jgi:hypothetical protein